MELGRFFSLFSSFPPLFGFKLLSHYSFCFPHDSLTVTAL